MVAASVWILVLYLNGPSGAAIVPPIEFQSEPACEYAGVAWETSSGRIKGLSYGHACLPKRIGEPVPKP
jgi:hypothetical protein